MVEAPAHPVKLSHILVADEVWVALAMLHQKHPGAHPSSAKEILDQVKAERACPDLRAGVQAHIYVHNVANVEPNSARYRMSYKLDDDTYRLYRPGDATHPFRKRKLAPERHELPEKYQPLLDWYEREYCSRESEKHPTERRDPILEMWGLGKRSGRVWTQTNMCGACGRIGMSRTHRRRSEWRPIKKSRCVYSANTSAILACILYAGPELA